MHWVFSCRYCGSVLLKPSDKYKMEKTLLHGEYAMVLIVENCVAGDITEVRCRAKNTVGETETKAKLMVQGE